MVKFMFQLYSLAKQQTLEYTGWTTEAHNYLHLNFHKHKLKQNIWLQQEEVNPLTLDAIFIWKPVIHFMYKDELFMAC
jgi:hypothetical protein